MTTLMNGATKEARARDIEQSDREYIAQQAKKRAAMNFYSCVIKYPDCDFNAASDTMQFYCTDFNHAYKTVEKFAMRYKAEIISITKLDKPKD